ncbi:uncharacterized protein LOC131648677 [Vicia villosa]|uniref:uncharacterized protein LOC131648677 n=1 Tax=Vicia villosa TaxID=3911 RepID=UPI00273B9FFD|nr:uncharacterized protein LOC131648677 [Vicia villosa]
MPTDEAQALINAADSKRFPSKHNFSKAGTRICTFYGKNNHTVENCFKKHGVQPHMQKQYSIYVNNASYEGGDQGPTSNSISNSLDMESGNSTMTQDQFTALMELIQKSGLNQATMSASSYQVGTANSLADNFQLPSPIHNPSFWIVDSGASDHICGSISWFQSYIAIPLIHVRLPNGHFLLSKYSGTDTTSLMMIGSADRRDGLYYSNVEDKPFLNNSTNVSVNSVSLPDNALCRYTWITLMITKYEARQLVINFVKLIEKQYSARVKTVRTDNGPEFNMPEFYATNGERHPSWDYHMHINSKVSSDDSVPNHIASVPSTSNSQDDVEHIDTTDVVEQHNDNTDIVEHIDEHVSSRPVRNKHTPAYLSNYVCNFSLDPAERSCNSSAKILYPISSFDYLSRLSESHHVFTTSIIHNVEPKNYKEACLSENWVKAMASELEALHKNKTWSIVDLPPYV